MNYYAIFEDVTDEGMPIFIIYDEDDEPICTLNVPAVFVDHSGLEIGDEVEISPQKST